MASKATPHRIFEIGELTRMIAVELILLSRRSTVNFACTSRGLKELVLGALWARQSSLFTLLMMLPDGTLDCQSLENGTYLVR